MNGDGDDDEAMRASPSKKTKKTNGLVKMEMDTEGNDDDGELV